MYSALKHTFPSLNHNKRDLVPCFRSTSLHMRYVPGAGASHLLPHWSNVTYLPTYALLWKHYLWTSSFVLRVPQNNDIGSPINRITLLSGWPSLAAPSLLLLFGCDNKKFKHQSIKNEHLAKPQQNLHTNDKIYEARSHSRSKD